MNILRKICDITIILLGIAIILGFLFILNWIAYDLFMLKQYSAAILFGLLDIVIDSAIILTIIEVVKESNKVTIR